MSIEARLAAAAEACRLTLREDAFVAVLKLLGSRGQPEQAFRLLSRITVHPQSGAELAGLCAEIASEPEQNMVERTLLLLAAQDAAAQVSGLTVSDAVKALFAQEFEFFANPPTDWLKHFQVDDVRFREMVRIATLRRFPAGQFHWEISGFPRSWVAKARQPWAVMAHVIGRMGGFAPLFELHLNARRRNRLVLLEHEADISYYRAARSAEKQAGVRGLLLASWLFCRSTAQVTPHLSWLRRTPESAGALLVELGPASTDSGFLIGSELRRTLYEQGLYRPTLTCVLWPRKALIDWANQHPEFDL